MRALIRIARPAALVFLLVLLSCGGEERPSRVLLLGIDGLDPQTIDQLMSEGKLPNFAKLRTDGAYGRLISQEPLLSPIVWTTIATGKTPDQHGIGHFVAVDAETGEELPVTSAMRKAAALWNIASAAEKRVATVGWWATWPPEEVNGVVVSDHTAYHFLFEDGFTGGKEGARTYPAELFRQLEPLLSRPGDVGPSELEGYVDVPAEELAKRFDFQDDLAHFRWALSAATSYRDIGLKVWQSERPDLELVYIEGVDSTSHLFGHLFRAEGLVGELARQQRRFGRAVEEMYLFADRLVGDYLAAMDEHTTLVVLSDHGFELGALHDDPTRTRDMRRVSERFHRIEGILYMYGDQVKRHARLERPGILDVAPTVLALLGMPAARDMPGRVLTEGLVDDATARGVARKRIASYEDGASGSDAAGGDAQVDDAVLARLRSLGYLGGTTSPEGDRNLAAMAFEAGRHKEAADAYRHLVEQSPEDVALRTSYAGALGALERYEEARRELEKAIELSPLNVEAYHNLAVIFERTGELQRAVELYREALRYRPEYEPSRSALLRLTGAAATGGPLSAAEQRAAELAEAAAQAARRGDYNRANELLDQAAQAAPRYALVYQYRSNVAYLMGDRASAITALEKALELEPDNALFRENLKRIRE